MLIEDNRITSQDLHVIIGTVLRMLNVDTVKFSHLDLLETARYFDVNVVSSRVADVAEYIVYVSIQEIQNHDK